MLLDLKKRDRFFFYAWGQYMNENKLKVSAIAYFKKEKRGATYLSLGYYVRHVHRAYTFYLLTWLFLLYSALKTTECLRAFSASLAETLAYLTQAGSVKPFLTNMWLLPCVWKVLCQHGVQAGVFQHQQQHICIGCKNGTTSLTEPWS